MLQITTWILDWVASRLTGVTEYECDDTYPKKNGLSSELGQSTPVAAKASQEPGAIFVLSPPAKSQDKGSTRAYTSASEKSRQRFNPGLHIHMIYLKTPPRREAHGHSCLFPLCFP